MKSMISFIKIESKNLIQKKKKIKSVQEIVQKTSRLMYFKSTKTQKVNQTIQNVYSQTCTNTKLFG